MDTTGGGVGVDATGSGVDGTGVGAGVTRTGGGVVATGRAVGAGVAGIVSGGVGRAIPLLLRGTSVGLAVGATVGSGVGSGSFALPNGVGPGSLGEGELRRMGAAASCADNSGAMMAPNTNARKRIVRRFIEANSKG